MIEYIIRRHDAVPSNRGWRSHKGQRECINSWSDSTLAWQSVRDAKVQDPTATFAVKSKILPPDLIKHKRTDWFCTTKLMVHIRMTFKKTNFE